MEDSFTAKNIFRRKFKPSNSGKLLPHPSFIQQSSMVATKRVTASLERGVGGERERESTLTEKPVSLACGHSVCRVQNQS